MTTILRPGDAAWDQTRQTFNLVQDQRPVAIALPRDAREVAEAITFAREHNLRVAPQATGHNAGPLGDLSTTLILNTSELTGVEIDAAARRVRVGAATKWEKVTPQLSELGLAALHGSSPDVGIVGYAAGGGLGWLGRKYGLHTNSVTAFEIVTADGRLLRADAEHHADLFWAQRGGGGNFGVVTSVEFEVFPHPELYAGAMFFGFEHSAEVLHTWRELLPTFPDELMTWATMLHFPPTEDVPEPFRGGSYVIIMGAYLGDEASGRALLRRVRDLGPVMDTFAMVPPAELAELAMDPPDPLPYHLGHDMLGELTESTIDGILEVVGPESGSGPTMTMVQLRHMGGALSRHAPGAGARATLPGEVSLLMLGVAADAATEQLVLAGIDRLHEVARPHRVASYPNFIEQEVDAGQFYDRETWARLREVKALYDPEDLFRGNHHVPPADAQATRLAA
jgi:FAD/FMN-containing dehydrogenase